MSDRTSNGHVPGPTLELCTLFSGRQIGAQKKIEAGGLRSHNLLFGKILRLERFIRQSLLRDIQPVCLTRSFQWGRVQRSCQ